MKPFYFHHVVVESFEKRVRENCNLCIEFQFQFQFINLDRGEFSAFYMQKTEIVQVVKIWELGHKLRDFLNVKMK